MMNYTLVIISGFSILIAAIIGLIRFRRIDRAYYSFLFLVWLALLNEIISYFVTKSGQSNALNSNIYELAESILIIVFFKRNKLFVSRPYIFYLVLALFSVAWVVDKCILSTIETFSSYFTILISFLLVLMSISMINRLTLIEKKTLVRNSIFLICTGFILFFTYALLVEIFWYYGLNSSRQFRMQIYRILIFINMGVNLIYALAILWMPRKQEYTLL